jgi:uncharacterized protein YlxW (UPF0749 family)
MADRSPTARPDDPDPVDRPLPPQATMGLLDYITAHSLDEDYAHVAAQRETPVPAGGRRRLRLASVAALGIFGLLVATAAIQTARSEPVRESSRDALVAKVQDQRAEMDETRAEVLRLRRAVERAQDDVLAASESGRILREQVAALELMTGAAAATGPGVRVVVDDNPEPSTGRQVVFDKDLQILVNGLWSAGAEAVSINDQRVTSLTSIRTAGDAITVNLRSLSRPYVVNALGDPDQLPARFVESAAGSWWLNLKSVYGLQFTMTREESLTVPAAPPLTLRHARPPAGEER